MILLRERGSAYEAREADHTAVVLNAHRNVGVAKGRGHRRWGGSIDEDGLVRGGVVGGAGGDAEEIFVCHRVENAGFSPLGVSCSMYGSAAVVVVSESWGGKVAHLT